MACASAISVELDIAYGASVTTTGIDAHALFAYDDTTIVNAGTLHDKGGRHYGISLNGVRNIVTHSGDILTEGEDVVGIYSGPATSAADANRISGRRLVPRRENADGALGRCVSPSCHSSMSSLPPSAKAPTASTSATVPCSPTTAPSPRREPPSTPFTRQHHDHHLRRYQRHRLRHLPCRRGQHGQLHEGHDAQGQGVRRRREQHLRLRRRPQRQHHHRRGQGLRTSLRQRRGLRLLHADVLRGRRHLQELHLRIGRPDRLRHPRRAARGRDRARLRIREPAAEAPRCHRRRRGGPGHDGRPGRRRRLLAGAGGMGPRLRQLPRPGRIRRHRRLPARPRRARRRHRRQHRREDAGRRADRQHDGHRQLLERRHRLADALRRRLCRPRGRRRQHPRPHGPRRRRLVPVRAHDHRQHLDDGVRDGGGRLFGRLRVA